MMFDTHIVVPPPEQKVGRVTIIEFLLFQGFLYYAVRIPHCLKIEQLTFAFFY